MKNLIKTSGLLIGLFLIGLPAMACEVCQQQQPKITQGLTHGAGPQSNWDWVIIAIITIIAALTLIFSLKYLIRPGETNTGHIKRTILNQ